MKPIGWMSMTIFGMAALLTLADLGERWFRKRRVVRYVRGWRARYGDDGEPM